MMGWGADTLLWTGACIALVLMIRRPVARWFGPQTAYALWALPMVRLLMPPVQLPSWLEPQKTDVLADRNPATMVLNFETWSAAPVATTSGNAGLGAAASDSASLTTSIANWDSSQLVTIAIAVWLIGAAAFLYIRFAAYFRLRRELLADACEVGRDGAVRLIETPATPSPLAFGVLSKVIALPRGFMAQSDKAARDLALAHELSHHRAHDLAVNMAVQPLFALHWFNPLGWYGWRALRRDQEAACDARVIADLPRDERAQRSAQYAAIIASFAAGPNAALAAPMACPVLGEKSIIHRLRSLSMNDQSTRRRIAGRAMLGAAALALPMTASISYAEGQVTSPAVEGLQMAAMGAAAQAAPNPPEPPAPPQPAPAPASPDAPNSPDAPEPPAPPVTRTIISVDPNTGEAREISVSENVTVVVDESEHEDGVEHRRIHTTRLINTNANSPLSDEERAEILKDVRESLAEANTELSEMPDRLASSLAELREAQGKMGRTVVKMECHSSSDDIATTTTDDDGTTTTMICQKYVTAHALEGLKQARKAISKSSDLDKKLRKDILKELDQQIKEWERKSS